MVARTGAPTVRIGVIRVAGRKIVGTILQTQKGPAYDLEIPVRVTTADGVEDHVVSCGSKEAPFSIEAGAEPKTLALDPDHHVFRKIRRERIAPCLEAVTTATRRVGFGDPALLKRLEVESVKPALPKDAAVLSIGLAPEVRTAIFVVPGLLGVILTTTMILMTSLAIVRERQ